MLGYRCECPPETFPPRCSRLLTLCSLANPCQNGGTCIPFGRSYRCQCPSDRTGRNCQMEVRSCGGVLNAFNGTLKYPLSSAYPHNSRCAWLIKTEEDKVLNITFSKFNLELSRECRYDWLQVGVFQKLSHFRLRHGINCDGFDATKIINNDLYTSTYERASRLKRLLKSFK